MTYLKILLAAPSLQKLVRQDMPLQVSYRLYKLIRHLNEEIEFFKEKDGELHAKYSDVDSKEYIDEYNSLLNLETDWNEVPIELKTDLLVDLSVSDIDGLEPFVKFVE